MMITDKDFHFENTFRAVKVNATGYVKGYTEQYRILT